VAQRRGVTNKRTNGVKALKKATHETVQKRGVVNHEDGLKAPTIRNNGAPKNDGHRCARSARQFTTRHKLKTIKEKKGGVWRHVVAKKKKMACQGKDWNA